jgi:hypothetical protein
MSQFMNLAPRTKGWSAVEAEILAWIENFEKESERNQILPTPAKPSCHIVPEPTVKLEGMEVRVKNIYNPGQSGVTSTLSVKPYPEAATLNSPSDESIYAQSYYNSHPYDSPSSSIHPRVARIFLVVKLNPAHVPIIMIFAMDTNGIAMIA